MSRVLAVLILFLFPFAYVAAPAGAQTPSQTPPEVPSPADQPDDDAPVYEEQLVVTASRTEQSLVNAPATVTLISGETIEAAAATGYADVFRSVPGLNVTQTSARDVNLTSRGATGTLSTSQLALVDGRSIYLDFFGFIAWDFLPVNPAEIKQIEVIRGPASAVWGANAMNGVVNVITRSPREMPGTTVTMGVGGFGRKTRFTPAGQSPGAGSIFYVNGSHARAVNDRWAYKVSAGVYSQDPLARPTGPIPNGTGTTYPDFVNAGTTQPKVDARVDYDFPDGRRKLVFQGGVAGTDGIMHSGIGPFDIDTGTVLGYGKVNYRSGGFHLNAFTNILQGDATNLLAVDVTGRPLTFAFGSRTFDVEAGHVRPWRNRHVFTYGGNFRISTFDLSIAPEGDSRAEGGVYLQDEIFLGEHVRWLVGARLDKFDVIGNVQFSPRTTLMLKPDAAQTIRLSYNRAYRAPSVINQYLDTAIINQLPLGSLNPLLAGRVFNFPVRAVGSNVGLPPAVPPVELTEQSITAYEIGYTGVIRQRATVSAAFFINETKDDIFFTQVASYRAASPPPGWASTGLPLTVLELLYCPPGTTPSPQRPCPFGVGNGLPAAFSYRNLGKVRQKGFEVGIDGAITREWSAYANYSYQPEPEAIGFPQSEINLPPANRVNAGVHYGGDRFLGSLSLSYQDEAFWRDVLDSRYSGPTDAFTLLNGSFGIRWGRARRIVTTIRATNLLNDDIQQHVFGDVSKLQVVGELRVGF